MTIRFGVVGAGTMGRGIAETGLVSGFDVVLLDISDELAQRAYNAVEKSLARGVDRGRITPGMKDSMLSRLKCGSNYSLLADRDVVIEAVHENMEVKLRTLERVSLIVPTAALIGSNTSSLSITSLSKSVSRATRFVGVHFFNPVPVMKLVEIVPGEATSEDTVARAKALAESMGKTPILVKESPGFVVNRLLCPLMNEAAYLVMDEVASPSEIDVAMKLGANHPIGPLALADLVGIDVLYAIMNTLYTEFKDPKYKPCPLLLEMVNNGKLGRKTGQGFFTY
ncbi:MAG: 3-hydroxyacyl-CoA dehydrogenase family protein [Bacillota bacterium]|jgi:3-hydroxybutyryl-CoA dehydrogenase